MWTVFWIVLALILILRMRSLAVKVKALSDLQLATSARLGEIIRSEKEYEGKLRALDQAVRGLKARVSSVRISMN
jgi:hypothetical protein